MYSTFLRAFWDDEGTVNYYPQHRTRKLRSPCKPPLLRAQLIRMHRVLGIMPREENDHYVTIGGSKNLARFRKRIGFTPGVRVGRAKFGTDVWAGHEKTDLLDRMVRTVDNSS
jgi:hypothetical protein